MKDSSISNEIQTERPHPIGRERSEGRGTRNPGYWVERIVAGLPVAEFDTLPEMLGLSVEEMARKVGISGATLCRRRAKKEPLDRDHSDHLMRYARLYCLSVGFFNGDTATGCG